MASRWTHEGRRQVVTTCNIAGCALKVPHTHEQTDFCHVCGASVPPRYGEGTCPDCPRPEQGKCAGTP
jgi:hypothetical protein